MNQLIYKPSIFEAQPNVSDSVFVDIEHYEAPFALISAILGALGPVANALPLLGVGTRSRIKEAEAIMQAESQKAKEQKTLMLIGGTLLLIIVVIVVTLKK